MDHNLTEKDLSTIRYIMNEMAIEGYVVTLEEATEAYLESESERHSKKSTVSESSPRKSERKVGAKLVSK